MLCGEQGTAAKTVLAARALQPVLLVREGAGVYQNGQGTVDAWKKGDYVGVGFNGAATILSVVGFGSSADGGDVAKSFHLLGGV